LVLRSVVGINLEILCLIKKREEMISSTDVSKKTITPIKTPIAYTRYAPRELKTSAKILGVKKVFLLGFEDGELNNNLYHKLAEKIQKILEELKPEKIMTDEIRGISGHIDHITVAMVTTFVFYKLPFIKELMYYCIEKREVMRDYFIYMPPGFDKKDVDLRIDISDVWDKKVAAIKAHKSQAHDGKYILSLYKKGIISKIENFLILKK